MGLKGRVHDGRLGLRVGPALPPTYFFNADHSIWRLLSPRCQPIEGRPGDEAPGGARFYRPAGRQLGAAVAASQFPGLTARTLLVHGRI